MLKVMKLRENTFMPSIILALNTPLDVRLTSNLGDHCVRRTSLPRLDRIFSRSTSSMSQFADCVFANTLSALFIITVS